MAKAKKERAPRAPRKDQANADLKIVPIASIRKTPPMATVVHERCFIALGARSVSPASVQKAAGTTWPFSKKR